MHNILLIVFAVLIIAALVGSLIFKKNIFKSDQTVMVLFVLMVILSWNYTISFDHANMYYSIALTVVLILFALKTFLWSKKK